MSSGWVTAGQLIDGGYSSQGYVYRLERARDQHISASAEGDSKLQDVIIEHNTDIMSHIYIKTL